MNESSPRITQMLHAWGGGDDDALDELINVVHDELHKIASRHLKRDGHGHSMQTTDLLNEAFEKLMKKKNVPWQNRMHFFALAARIMRGILIDHARTRFAAKRGGGSVKVSLDDVALVSENRAEELISLDNALMELAKIDSRKSRIVELKFFGGLTTEEIAEMEQMSSRSIERELRKAKAWLYDAIN